MWEVLEYTLLDGWVNTWSVDGETETFPTEKAAQDALDEYLTDCQEAYDQGHVEDVPMRSCFIIRPVGGDRSDLETYVPYGVL